MRWTFGLIGAAMFAAFGCGTTEPVGEVVLTMQNIAGTYYGLTITSEENGVVTDQYWRGARIELILQSDSATAGRIFIPPDTAGCCGVDTTLAGSWLLDGNTVTLSLVNDTFLRAMSLVFEETHLTGMTTLDGVTYRVVLAW